MVMPVPFSGAAQEVKPPMSTQMVDIPYIHIYILHDIPIVRYIIYIHIIIPMYHYVCWFIMASCMITISSPLYQHLSSVQCYTGWLRTGFHFMDNDDP